MRIVIVIRAVWARAFDSILMEITGYKNGKSARAIEVMKKQNTYPLL